MEELDCLQEACGLFACVACGEWPTNLDVAHIIYLGLVALQHRGQEMAGIVTSKGENKKKYAVHRGVGNVSQVFSEDHLRNLRGNLGIGHTRYSTHGGTEHQNAQPFVVYTLHGLLAVAHNGELVNAKNLRNKILENGVGLSTGSDSELITQILSMPPPEGEPHGADWLGRIRHLMALTLTAYSLVIMHDDVIFAVRDPFGNRPLCIGELLPPGVIQESKHGDFEPEGWIVSSETCVFPSVSAKLHREIEPGEIVQVTKHGIRSIGTVSRPDNKPPALCIFEYVYFARPDSILEGQMVYMVRKECGRQLALEAAFKADIVSTVPESATPSALGFSEVSGIPYAEVLCKNRYVGRTFIQPNPYLRQLAVAKKFGPLSANFRGKKIILIDDSIVRGTTIGAIIRLLKESGAKEVHIRIASPPLHYPCYMGINIPTREELIANELNADQLAKKLGANSLVYLSVGGLLSAVQRGISNNGKPSGHCTACLTGKYPVELEW
ncbi:amidophosphoribosyltransferase-like isoform X1 [Limulus polyphemus]|uniref:Amidophosphoribosyltransferase n=1 Tax=Limulus polyphemus TaxID=6850 RepID=A0ABM1BSV7_LIMPO|nr:amidophosphoribosyltransferase-like isoform X1 [Limulus polyphemus]XP_022256263.1 amidophosphoribosyltransferase-like isoform X1 [Limulus polyphemus]